MKTTLAERSLLVMATLTCGRHQLMFSCVTLMAIIILFVLGSVRIGDSRLKLPFNFDYRLTQFIENELSKNLPEDNLACASMEARSYGDRIPRSYTIFYNLSGKQSDITVTIQSTAGKSSSRCPGKATVTSAVTCTYSRDWQIYNESVAAVFHDDTPLNAFPPYRPANQMWIMQTMEVSSCQLINNSATVPPVEWKGIKNLVAKKERAVAWFVTHCWTSSKRESYVAELRRYIDVDVYGQCGPLRCGVDKWNACVNMVENRYYFYLSFENSLCLDYATEKFWQLTNRDVIAVVLGAANYTRLGAVPGTYLDVRDFRSPRLLAEYMKQLMANDGKLYAELIVRKRRVQCVTPAPEAAEGFGERLCRYVDSNRGRLQTIDLQASWNPSKICIEPQKFYKGIADMIVTKTNEI